MLVYVQSLTGQPLMPTERCGKVRRLINSNQAKVIKRCPFTIQLLYESTTKTQAINLGIDAGSKTIGVSATTKARVLYESEVEIRNDISSLISFRKELRQNRRSRKTRYRKPRYNNRSRKEKWLAPSVQHKVNTHIDVIKKVCSILPVNDIFIETASFDIQLIKANDKGEKSPIGTDYQQGDLFHFANLREFCFWRDNYTCQWCHGKSKSKILHMHHWNYWNGDHTNKPSSVITLCDICNNSKNHRRNGFLWGWQPKIAKPYTNAAFMNTMRWSLFDKLEMLFSDKNVHMTYGYITKCNRIKFGLSKTHYIDARCISNNPLAVSMDYIYFQKKVRCHNRQIHKCKVNKNGNRRLAQAPYKVYDFRLYDKVEYQNQVCFIFGRRTKGDFEIRLLDGTKIKAGVSYKKLKFLETRKSYLTERRPA